MGQPPGTKGHTIKVNFDYALEEILPGLLEVEAHLKGSIGFYIVRLDALNCISLGLADVDISSQDKASGSIGLVEGAIDKILKALAGFAANEKQFEDSIRRNLTELENISAAKSRIVDTDFAKESLAKIKSEVEVQAGIIAMSHREINPAQVYELLDSSQVTIGMGHFRISPIRVRAIEPLFFEVDKYKKYSIKSNPSKNLGLKTIQNYKSKKFRKSKKPIS